MSLNGIANAFKQNVLIAVQNQNPKDMGNVPQKVPESGPWGLGVNRCYII